MQLDLRKRYSALALMCSMTGFLPLTAGAAPGHILVPVQTIVPADSFIARHVGTVTELHQQITLDPVVRRRLARHFHTSAPAVTRYIQENLVLTTLKKSGRYQVYCVGRTGQEYTINSRLAAGTPVFVLRSTGQPVLKLACGNPMVAALPPVTTKVADYRSPALAPALGAEAAPVPLSPLAPNSPVIVAMADTPGVVVMPTTKVAGFIGQLPVPHGGGFPLGYLAAIPVIATVAGGHGGGTSPSISTGTTTGTTGTSTNGNNTSGTSTSGTATAGTNTLGTDTSGTSTNGNNTSGNNTSGTATAGTNTLGTDTSGTSTNGNNTTSTSGNNTSGTATAGTDTLGSNTNNTGVTPVPEPGTPAAFAVGGAAILYLLGSAKRRRKIG